MKQDLDRLMEERGLDAAVISGNTYGNPSLIYMLNGANVSNGDVIKKRGEEPYFVHSPIERDEAVATGLQLINRSTYNLAAIMKEKGDFLAAHVEFYRRLFDDLGVEGRVGFYGMDDAGAAYVFLKALGDALPHVEVCGELTQSLIEVARGTKDAAEVAMIRESGRLTCEVVRETIAFLRRHRVEDETLVTEDGSPLTIGRVKQHINHLMAERRLEDPEGLIFAIGRDAGVPHNAGNPDDPIRLGQSIVYDIYPRRVGGYFFDCTRTFCLGYAPPEVEKVYWEVKACVDAVIAATEVGKLTRDLQQLTCDFFKERGHPTIDVDEKTDEGYVHSVGHGLGLAIHEEPFFSGLSNNQRTVQPGHVFTVEPGLYYPSRGFGVRIEDVVWVDENGAVHNLTDLPYELVVEME
ncbi:MAG: aminopeptidase P family protein [Anaerolineae bacterium]|nr:aminopeptidase P family protein [Anaerolineae bacterium]